MIEEKLMNLLSTRKYTRIFSSKTKKAYIDSFMRCYLFESPSDAAAFCEKVKDTYAGDKNDYIKSAPFLNRCYADGIDAVRIKTTTGDSFIDIPIKKEDVQKQYYNRKADGNLLQFKETSKAHYLRKLAECEFLCPIVLDKRNPGKHPGIHYATASLDGGYVCYIFFTTLQSFDAWNKNNGERFLPNKTTFEEFASIRKSKPVIINPETDMLYLDNKTITALRERK